MLNEFFFFRYLESHLYKKDHCSLLSTDVAMNNTI
jgi:hypothetical protein